MAGLESVLTLDDLEPLAEQVLSEPHFAYYAGGAGQEVTLRDNSAAFGKRKLRPRVLVDVSEVDTSTDFLGEPVPFPFGLAPNAQHGFAHPEGEVATSRAAASVGCLMCLSTLSTRSLEDVAAAGAGPRWFQLYLNDDREVTRDLVTRATRAGYSAIVVTADLPFPGLRERELRHPVVYEDDFPFGNFEGIVPPGTDMMTLLDDLVDRSVTWDDLDWIVEISDVPVLVKGILTREDAALAVNHGAAGIVVSNHGGRQLDRAVASIDALDEVVDEVSGRAEVYLDGGVRRGVDVAVAIALGAKGVFIGRPYLYGLAVAGEDGVRHCIELLRGEFENAMGLLGVTGVAGLGPGHVF